MPEYRGRQYSTDAFERQFNPRAIIPDVEAIQARRAAMAEDARRTLRGELGLPYGSRDREFYDLFLPEGSPDAPVLVFFHGGYWRGGSARENSFVAAPFVAAGAIVAVVNYDLCPAVTVADIVDQSRRAIAAVHEEAAAWGGDPMRLHLMGHSAGAQLAALAIARDRDGGVPAAALAGVALISGVYDLEPVLQISVNEEIRLGPEDVAPLSPLLHPPRADVPVLMSVGLAESEEWVRQSHLYRDLCTQQGARCRLIEVEGADHYSILLDMTAPDHPLTGAMLGQMGL